MRSSANQLSGGGRNKLKYVDDLTEDLSLGLILDDRDDSVIGENWSDEDEDILEDDFVTPRHLPTLDENDDPDQELNISQRKSRSGRWSSFSWSSLYERATDSSLSWADDELEKETTDKVKSLFQSIDHCLYQDGEHDDAEEERPNTSDSFRSFQPCLSDDLKQECAIWREKFPHLRVLGKAILSEQYQVQNNSKRHNYYQISESPKVGNLSASSVASDVSTVSLGNETTVTNNGEEEEIFAIEGTYVDEDKQLQLMEGVTLNEKFIEDPKKYFEEKLMMAIFRKVWSKISQRLDLVANMHSEWVLDEQLNHAPSSHFLAIDENAIFNGNGLSPLGGKIIRTGPRTKSPISEVNSMPPVYLPDLRPTVASAPPVRDLLQQSKRPGSSQNVRFAIDGASRASRRTSLRIKRSNTATANTRPSSRLTRYRNGKSLENKRSPSDERKSANNYRRTRSKSGSPPSRVSSSMGYRSGIQAGQPVSLPPIFNHSDTALSALSGPTSLTSGYSSMSSRLGTASSSSSGLTPRSSSNLKLDGKVTPTLPKSPSDRGISVSGTKLKKLNYEESGRSSRLSAKTPAHWDIRTFTPSQPRPRFRN